jgi:peptidoglycan DL-endopeptidase CwlO
MYWHTSFRPAIRLVGLVAMLFLLGWIAPATPAAAQPGPGEEGPPTLGEVLEAANREYLDAQARLENSQKRQAELVAQAASVEVRLQPLIESTAAIAVAAYRTGGLRMADALLNSESATSFLSRATTIDALATYNDRQLRELNRLRTELATTRAAIDTEVANQQQQAAAMKKRQDDAERALAAVGGRATGGYVSVTSPLAKPAPRRADGSWAPESCIIDDPTSGGCLTPRTLHALQQARAAGFTRHTGCWRGGDRFEHPKGRACDFAASAGGFGGVATGGDRLYGNNLTAFFVRNARALGVLYVIWYEQIWQPTTGWRAYRSGRGDPSSDHTNHVHLSII